MIAVIGVSERYLIHMSVKVHLEKISAYIESVTVQLSLSSCISLEFVEAFWKSPENLNASLCELTVTCSYTTTRVWRRQSKLCSLDQPHGSEATGPS
jgi:hypothetical protein